jgi:dienelactone hydrolase
LGGYRADPATPPKAAIVVIREIFGVNHHIRAVCDRLADEGYVAIAPSIFDRVERNSSAAIRRKKSRRRASSLPIPTRFQVR